MKAVYKRELRAYFTSMIGCAFAAFLIIIGGIYFMVYNLSSGYPFFAYSLSGVIFAVLITIPVLSMKCFAEERKNKTDQLLLTSPVPLLKIILGKYFAMITVFAIPCLVYCLFPLIIKFQGNAHLLVDYSSILAFYLLGCVFIGIGMFLSSLTESPVIAAISTCGVLFFLYMLDNLLNYVPTGALSGVIILIIVLSLAAGLIYHITKNQVIAGTVEAAGVITAIAVYFIKPSLFENLIHDILEHLVLTDVFYNFAQNYIFDIGGLLYYLSIIILFIYLTIQTFQKRRWS
ncbi:ABC transporter permease [Anaerostipes sp.]|uniref:ABC transporter permease n=1 Tax=Anaerostipes sp. TaxID=1872530 RepID=UPI0025BBAAEC|nr:ABC transporter permease subunit [Anaerostipes sp.]MBS7008858.1 ABC transporter permease subunit [Anaerostipes sp.]